MRAVAEKDLEAFDRALFGHLGFALRNAFRAFGLGLTHGRLARAPKSVMRRYAQRLGRLSAAFALVSEAAMATLGGRLKRREAITGRLADALAWLYIGSAVLKRFHDEGEPASTRPFAQWAVEHALAEVERALAGVLRNLPSRPVAWLLALLAFPLGRSEPGPDDALGSEVAEALQRDDRAREALTAGIFVPHAGEAGLGGLEAALEAVKPALEIEARLRALVREGKLTEPSDGSLARAAFAAGMITESDLGRISAAEAARERAIQVDTFDPDEFRALRR
jgi:acyl-CoA dehydrogenase